jgi:hypothetical protein
MCRRKNKVSAFLDVTGILATAALIAITVAFATPYWFRADPDRITSRVTPYQIVFHSLGLWMLCCREYPPVPQDVYWQYKYACRDYLSLNEDVKLPGIVHVHCQLRERTGFKK